MHHNPKFWPEPQVYKPERFLAGAPEIKEFTFLPFIGGPRNCLGQFLSLLESKIVLSILLKRYDFELVDEEEAGKRHSFMIPIIPKSGLFVKVH